MSATLVSKMNKSRIPAIILAIFVVVEALALIGVLPPIGVISIFLGELFHKYGLPAVFIFSFIENLAGANTYFPGSIVILTSMSMTAGNISSAILTYASITSGAFLAYNINYVIGRRFVRGGNSIRHKKTTLLFFMSTFWHPQFAALTCLAAGGSGQSYGHFLRVTFIAGFAWNTFWGVLMYNVGLATSANIDMVPIVFAYLVCWLLFSIYDDIKSQSRLRPSHSDESPSL